MKKLIVGAMLLFNTTIFAQETYTIGVEDIDYYPLYSYKDNQYSGFSKDVLEMFAKAKGYKFEYKAYPINRLYKAFLSGDVDFKYPDNKMWAQDIKNGKDVYYSDAVVDYIDGAMVTPQNKDLKAENLKNIGTVMGFTAWDYMDMIKSNKITVSENPNFANLLKQTIAGRTDLAYSNIAVAKYHLENTLSSKDALVFNPNLPHTKSSYLLSSQKHKKVLEELNVFLKDNKDKINELKKKYAVE